MEQKATEKEDKKKQEAKQTQIQKHRTVRKLKSHNQKSADFKKLVVDKVRTFGEEGYGQDGRELQNEIFLEALTQHSITKEDIDYGNNLVELVRKEREESDDGVVYWKQEYIDQIGLPEKPKLVFVKGGKNIGKTYGIAKFLERELAEYPTSQVMLVRTTRLEVFNGMTAQLSGTEWPFYFQQNRQLLIRKDGRLLERGKITERGKGRKKGKTGHAKRVLNGKDDQEEVIKEALADEHADICGFCTYANANGFRSFQGSSGKKLRHVIGDECNDVGNVTPQLLSGFLTFLLSLERNNKEMRVGLYGNLLRRDDGSAADLILDFFKIPYDCNLKFFRTKKGTPCLYINTGEAGDLFDGVDTQSYTDLFGLQHAQDLTSNMPIAPTKVLNRGCFYRSTPLFSFVFEYDYKFIIIYVAQLFDIEELGTTYYVLHGEQMSSSWYVPDYYPVSSCLAAVNCFNFVAYKKPKKIAKLVKKLRKMQKRKLLFYSSDDVRMEWFKIEKRLVSTYAKELDGEI